MADEALLQILRHGSESWNKWRLEHSEVTRPDLSEADLSKADLSGANLTGANLFKSDLTGAALSSADLSGADLLSADLSGANFTGADFSHADLAAARLSGADLTGANLSGAHLFGAYFASARLFGTDLTGTYLFNADFSEAILSNTRFDRSVARGAAFCDLDMRGAVGLESINHLGPSTVSINTIYKSEGKIPEAFLRGCGVPESFIVQIPALVAAMQPIQFHSCFISYSTRDEEFARRLHARMRQADLRVWFAPEDIKGGQKLYEQIDRAIQVHDRLLLVLSEDSMKSEWVMTEIRRARKTELKEGRRKLFPIRLVGYDAIREWECFDADQGKDLAVEVREYYIPDFSNWKNHDDFELEFNRLYESLKAEA